MKLGQPQVNHPFDLITRRLSEIARQLIHQKMQRELQAHVTYLALKSKVLLFYLDEFLVRPQAYKGINFNLSLELLFYNVSRRCVIV